MYAQHFKNRKRVIAGRMAKTNGSAFENLLQHSAEVKGFRTVRIPDGCMQIGPHKLIRVKSPFDFVFVRGAQIVFCDAKCVTDENFSYSKVNQTQLEKLRLLEAQGHKAGFIIHFARGVETITCFAGAYQLNALRQRQSLTPQSLVRLGALNEIDLGLIFNK